MNLSGWEVYCGHLNFASTNVYTEAERDTVRVTQRQDNKH